jgi:hypothetical protein
MRPFKARGTAEEAGQRAEEIGQRVERLEKQDSQ